MAVTGAMDFALDDDTVTAVVAVMAVDKKSEDGCDEKEDDVPEYLLVKRLKVDSQGKNLHDAECP
jgi:hypothetical protein